MKSIRANLFRANDFSVLNSDLDVSKHKSGADGFGKSKYAIFGKSTRNTYQNWIVFNEYTLQYHRANGINSVAPNHRANDCNSNQNFGLNKRELEIDAATLDAIYCWYTKFPIEMLSLNLMETFSRFWCWCVWSAQTHTHFADARGFLCKQNNEFASGDLCVWWGRININFG